jgi:tyrosine-protein phosphatase SIW14
MPRDRQETACPARRRRWALRAQGFASAVALIALIVLIHYWPGITGWAAYFGRPSGVFDFSQPSHYALATPRNDIPGLTNFAQVSRNLYRAAAIGPMGYLQAKKLGVRTIVDLRQAHTDLPHLMGLGLNYVWIPTNQAGIKDEQVVDFLRVVRDPDLQPVLVHCKAGSDRTGTMVAIYRVMEQNWPVDQAALELPRFGFHQIWVPLLEYLRTFDRAHINSLAATRPMPRVMRSPRDFSTAKSPSK